MAEYEQSLKQGIESMKAELENENNATAEFAQNMKAVSIEKEKKRLEEIKKEEEKLELDIKIEEKKEQKQIDLD